MNGKQKEIRDEDYENTTKTDYQRRMRDSIKYLQKTILKKLLKNKLMRYCS